MNDVPRPRPLYLHREVTRHGTVVWYVRKGKGPRIRLHETFGTDAFNEEYQAAISGAPKAAARRPAAHTLQWGIDRYRQSSAWAALKPATRKQRGNIYRAVIATAGSDSLDAFTEEAIMQGRERRAATPHAANNFLKAMRGFFGWAAGDGKLVATDPTRGVKLLRGPNDERGFAEWTEEEVARYEARWPLGTKQRLALDVFCYTGFRRGDAARFGRQHVRDGIITVRTEKTGTEVTFPLLPELAESITATPTGDLAFITGENGMPFTKESLGNWFRDAARAAGVMKSPHGLRKIAATRVADGGATVHQMMALFGWTTEKMALQYTRAADRKKLASAAAPLLVPAQKTNALSPHLKSGAGTSGEK